MDGFKVYEDLLKKSVQSIKTEAGDQYKSRSIEDQVAIEENRPKYTEQFLSQQSASQKSFYEEYKNNWKAEYDGAKIDKTNYIDPREILIQDDNLTFFQKTERKKVTRDQISSFESKMKELTGSSNEMEVEKQGKYTNNLMCANIRLASIEKKKDEIIDEALKKADKKNLLIIGDYLPFLRNLGPELIANDTNDVNDEIEITQKSVAEYRAFIERAFKNPVAAIKESINDAIHGYGRISTKLLQKNVIPNRFDEVKQLRDRYKAVHDIMRSPINDPGIKGALSDIKKNTLLKDNVTFATEMYRRLDADLSYCMKENGLSFTSDRFLDHTDEEGGAYATKGDLTLKTIMDQKNMVKDKDKEDNVDTYWRSELSSELLQIEIKPQVKKIDDDLEIIKRPKRQANKASAELHEGFDIITTADRIAQDFDTTDDEKQFLFDELKENVKGIASAIADINHELEVARMIYGDQKRWQNLLRPELLKRIPWYVGNRQQQLLNLMDRVAGYLNAMRYLTGKAALNANGAQVIKSEQARKKNESKKDNENKEGNESFGFISNDTAVIDMNSKGPGKDIVALNRTPLSFDKFKKKIKKQLPGSGPDYSRLAQILDGKDASLRYDILLLEGKDLESMNLAQLQKAFEEKKSLGKRISILTKSVQEYLSETEILYARLKDGGIFTLNDEERNDIVDRAVKLRQKLYSINRIKNLPINEDGSGVRYSTIVGGKLSSDKKFKYLSEDLTRIKYKVVFDQLEQYRCQMISNQVRIGAANDEMYTADEKKDIESRLKKNKVVDDKSKDGRSKDFIIMQYYIEKLQRTATLTFRHQDELAKYLEGNKRAKTIEEKRKALINKAIELENRAAKEKFEKKKADIKAEKERKKKEKEEHERKLKEQKEKEEQEKKELEKKEAEKKEAEKKEAEKKEAEKKETEKKEAEKKETEKEKKPEKKESEKKEEKPAEKKEEKPAEKKEEKPTEKKAKKKEEKPKFENPLNTEAPAKGELFRKANMLKTKYTVPVSQKRQEFPYSDRRYDEPATDSWAHSLASVINDMAGKYVVDGKMILEDKDMNDTSVFGKQRTKLGEPTDYLQLINKYVPNTAVAKTTFESLEFSDKGSFLSFVKKALTTTKNPLLLKRKGTFVTVYGIDKNNQLLCKRSSTEYSSELYTEDPDVVFSNMEQEGDVSLYWLQKVKKDKKVAELKDEKQQIEYKIPENIIDEKEAKKKIEALKKIEMVDNTPAPLYVRDKVTVEDPTNHSNYERQGNTQYCWACTMNGMINHMIEDPNEHVTLGDLVNYEMKIPEMKDTRINNEKDYISAVDELNNIQAGSKVGNPMIFADYIFQKLPGTIVRSAQIYNTPGKTALCKRRFKEELSKALEYGPVGLLRDGHFILVYELDGDVIKAKDSLRSDSDKIKADRFTVETLYDKNKCDGNIELVWLENIKGYEKEFIKEFDDLAFDEKTNEFKKIKNNGDGKATGFSTMLHKNGIEVSEQKNYDVVNQMAYVPVKMQ